MGHTRQGFLNDALKKRKAPVEKSPKKPEGNTDTFVLTLNRGHCLF